MSHPYSMKSLPHAPGALIFTPCPGTQTSDLDESLETLKQAGAVALVTLMSDTELQKNGAGELGVAARQHGLEWYQLPIEDDQAPDQNFELGWERFATSWTICSLQTRPWPSTARAAPVAPGCSLPVC